MLGYQYPDASSGMSVVLYLPVSFMANELTVDLTDPAMQEAFAACEPGETSTITMDIAVSEKGATLVADIDPASVEKYAEEEVEEVVPVEEGAPPEAVTIVMEDAEKKTY